MGSGTTSRRIDADKQLIEHRTLYQITWLVVRAENIDAIQSMTIR